ncbi:hypothetical protein N7V09_15920 [Shewanella seohaensis]|uniref:hypothetical protein n=1 Tax=Shewanella seohaensis TaxID=755175 RepID=UPI00200FA226|nr:hypothetical protein [Shewanella seohaensis]MCL1122358.1 hypothetical protein [Shewanella seohaensis]UXM81271.1 hypothetical protein N7V09_15920 [Shewanella seohaensis]
MNTLTLPGPSIPVFKPALTLRFNQLVIFHSLLLLALSLLCEMGLKRLGLETPLLSWGVILYFPVAVSLSLLLKHSVSRRSLAWLFGLWMLLWLVM